LLAKKKEEEERAEALRRLKEEEEKAETLRRRKKRASKKDRRYHKCVKTKEHGVKSPFDLYCLLKRVKRRPLPLIT
jgi:hypothetical protein